MTICGKDLKIQGRLIRIGQVDGDQSQLTFLDQPETILQELRKSKTRIDIFTFLQNPPDTLPKYTYPIEWDNLSILPISTFEYWWKHQVHSNIRVKVRKGEKNGLEIRDVPFDDALVRGVCEIYNECPIRQGRPFPHYGIDVERARQYARSFLERSIFLGAYLGGRMVGFAKLVTDEDHSQAGILHLLAMIQHRDKAVTNSLIAQAVRSCAERKIQYLTYGRFVYGKKKVDSLSQFKEANGFRRLDLPRYYVPLTPLGSLAVRLGLYRNVRDRVPEPVLAKCRELRAAWYNRKLTSAPGSASL